MDADVGSIQLLINPVSSLSEDIDMAVIPEELAHHHHRSSSVDKASNTLLVLVSSLVLLSYVCTGGVSATW